METAEQSREESSLASAPNPAEAIEAVKAAGHKAGGLVIGVAPVDAFNEYVPDGHRPKDILPGARSVVVAGNQGPTAGAWRCPDHRTMEITGYDFRENVAVHVMCDFIEGTFGYKAIQAPSLPTAGHQPPMSMMLAAVLAGLGTRSLATNIILHPGYGMLYFAALITTLPLGADPRLEKDVCPHPMCVQTYRALGTTPCMAACPADDGGCLDGHIGEDGRIADSYYDHERCVTRSQNFAMGGFQKAPTEIVNEDDPENRHAMIQSEFFATSISSLGYY